MPTDDPILLEAIDAAIADARADGGVPGVAVAATDRDGPIVHREAGHADPAAGRAVEPGTLFEIGSIGNRWTFDRGAYRLMRAVPGSMT